MAFFVLGLDEERIGKKKGLRERERETHIRKRLRVKIRLKEIEKAIETRRESLFEREPLLLGIEKRSRMT